MLGEVVVDDQRVPAALHELLAHGACRRRGRCTAWVAGSAAEATTTIGVVHRAVLFEHAHGLGDLGLLLADGDVDADHVAVASG